jgi:hypothetical protein
MSDGTIFVDDRESTLGGVDSSLRELAAAKGIVWYYREHPGGESPPAAGQVIQLVIANHLPISFSTKPDFSDVVDPRTGVSRPRT